jgi:tetratricopeptide (TPR) repeat protein
MAAQVDPTSAAQSYFNIGAVYTNAGKVDEANAAFDKCIAADPTRAEAYYQKGLNLLGKATLQGDKTVAPPGTAEALQKYLELTPNGPNAQSAKDLLTSLGATVETSFGTKKKAPPKKQSHWKLDVRKGTGRPKRAALPAFRRSDPSLDVTKDYVLAGLRVRPAARYS